MMVRIRRTNCQRRSNDRDCKQLGRAVLILLTISNSGGPSLSERPLPKSRPCGSKAAPAPRSAPLANPVKNGLRDCKRRRKRESSPNQWTGSVLRRSGSMSMTRDGSSGRGGWDISRRFVWSLSWVTVRPSERSSADD